MTDAEKKRVEEITFFLLNIPMNSERASDLEFLLSLIDKQQAALNEAREVMEWYSKLRHPDYIPNQFPSLKWVDYGDRARYWLSRHASIDGGNGDE